MAQVIRNPKYKGRFCVGMTTVADPFDLRQIKQPEEEWMMHPDENIPALVTEETWAKANERLAKRSADVKRHRGQYTHANPRSCKMDCAHCTTGRRPLLTIAASRAAPEYAAARKKGGTHTGPSKYTWESEMKGMLFTLFKGFHQSGADMAKRILHPLEQLQPRTSVASEREKTQAANEVAGRRGSA